MADLHIVDVDRLEADEVIVTLSDGRAISFTLQQLLTLTPEREITDQQAEDEA